MDTKTELRKIKPGNLFTLVQILEQNDLWKRLMAIIPKTLPSDTFESKMDVNNLPKYHSNHFKLIEDAGFKQRRPCTEIFFEEWGTSGRIRPCLGHLLWLLERAELYRAADYVAVDLLKVSPPERPKTGPAAKVRFNIDLPNENEEVERILDNINYPSSILNSVTLKNNMNENHELQKLVIPKIIVDDINDSNSDNNQVPNNSNSKNSSNASLAWREVQLEKKIEKLRYSPQIPENITESTSVEDTFSDKSVSDMIQFSFDNQMPAFSSLLNDASVVEAQNDYLPRFSGIMQSETFPSGNVPDFGKILSESESKETNELPAFSQLLNSNNNIPAFSQILTSTTATTDIIPNLSALQPTNDKIHVSDISKVTSRNTCPSPLPNLSLNTVLPHFTYLELDRCTGGFDETELSNHSIESDELKGRKLGSGAFGSVYLAIGLMDRPVAVKKLSLNGLDVVNVDDTITKQFRNEVEILCKYKHENLLSLLGYSCDGPTYCLIYEYISGGALKDRLQCVENILIWTNRLYIALGTARAISYLHNAYSTPLIHRDIKSANILLDNSDKPKLCDFGLIKLTPNQNTNTSTTVFGTSAYMAPEAFRGDVSVKLDTFSFGVVLLELLTGLPPLDESRQGNDLVTHVEEVCEDADIKPLLDSKAGSWCLGNTQFGELVFAVAVQCLEEKKRRPLMADIVGQLTKLIDKAH